MDTIFALATAQGRAGVAVIRISGKMAAVSAGKLMKTVPEQRGLRKLVDSEGVHLDDALVLVFPDTNSFTGEPVVELHLHGSIAVVNLSYVSWVMTPTCALRKLANLHVGRLRTANLI